MAEPTEQVAPPIEEAGPKKPGLMTIVKAVAFISVIVLLEVAAASIFVPSAEETTKIAEKLAVADATKGDKESAEHGEEGHEKSLAHKEMREVSLGSYHVLTYNPDTGSSVNVDFELYGTVLAEEEPDFFKLYEANQIRIREQILVTIRGTEVTDLTEAGLGLIKRKILEKTNRTLGKPLLQEAVFSKFSFIER
jgi:hypothetical protein